MSVVRQIKSQMDLLLLLLPLNLFSPRTNGEFNPTHSRASAHLECTRIRTSELLCARELHFISETCR